MQRTICTIGRVFRVRFPLVGDIKVPLAGRSPLNYYVPFNNRSLFPRSLHSSSVNRSSKSVDFKLSDIGEGISEVTVKEWYISVGSKVLQFDPICEVQSDKASVTITSRYDGIIKKINYEVGHICKVGASLVEIEIEVDTVEELHNAPKEKQVSNPTPQDLNPESDTDTPVSSTHMTEKVLATPAVRRLAKEMNISLDAVKATGKHGRVLKDDIITYSQSKSHVDSTVLSETEDSTQPKTVYLSGYTKVMLKTMTESLQVPLFGYKDEISLDALMAVRKDLVAEAKKQDVKLSYMPFFIKAASVALLKHPILNASLSECKEKLIYNVDHNIGLAMDTPEGLIVPNIKNCQRKSILEIAADLNRLHEASLNGKVNSKDLVGGTFSLSNVGSIGGTYTFPILVQPELCIGALGKIRKLPRFSSDGEIIAAHIINISWSADHRVIDGATLSRFSNHWKDLLEKPHLLLMTLK